MKRSTQLAELKTQVKAQDAAHTVTARGGKGSKMGATQTETELALHVGETNPLKAFLLLCTRFDVKLILYQKHKVFNEFHVDGRPPPPLPTACEHCSSSLAIVQATCERVFKAPLVH